MNLRVAAVAGVLFAGAASAQDYIEVEDWLTPPPGRQTLGGMHGDIAVSANGDVYVSVETEGQGIQVFSAGGDFLRYLDAAPADLHGFVIRDVGDGEYLYGVSLRGQKFVKMTLDGDIVLEVARGSIPRQFWIENQFSDELGVLLSGMDVAPNGDMFVTDGYASDTVHRFDAQGNYIETFGGKAAPYEFNILHKIAIDTRFDPLHAAETEQWQRVLDEDGERGDRACDDEVERTSERRVAAGVLGAGVDHLDDVDATEQFIDEVLRDPACHGRRLAAQVRAVGGSLRRSGSCRVAERLLERYR